MKILISAAVILSLAILARAAWLWWPPVGRYMVRHTQTHIRDAVRQYLDGGRDVESVATEIVRRANWVQRQGWPDPDTPEKGVATLTAVTLEITPAGYSPSDSRLVTLVDRMNEFLLGSERYREMQERIRRSQER